MRGEGTMRAAMSKVSIAARLRKWQPLNEGSDKYMVRIRWPRLRAVVARYIGLDHLAEKTILRARAGDELYVKIVTTALKQRHAR